jgi:hypothetical protein
VLGSEIKRAGGRAASPIARAPLRSKVRLISVLWTLPFEALQVVVWVNFAWESDCEALLTGGM